MADGSLVKALQKRAVPRTLPDQSPYQGLSLSALADIAQSAGRALPEVEIVALKNQMIPQRYVRNFHTMSRADQIHLLESRVAVVGLGGLGGPVAELLARAGVGFLRLIDGDRFDESNLNRQLFSELSHLHRAKAEIGAERIARVNPAVQTDARDCFFTPDNGAELLEGCHLAVDCLDRIPARFDLERAGKQAGIPLVSAAVAGVSGQVTAIFPEDPGLCQIHGPPEGSQESGAESELGTLAYGAMLISSLQCAEVVRILLKKPGGLQKRLLLVDLNDYSFDIVELGDGG